MKFDGAALGELGKNLPRVRFLRMMDSPMAIRAKAAEVVKGIERLRLVVRLVHQRNHVMNLEIRASRRPRNKELMRRIELALVLAQLKSLFHKFAAFETFHLVAD